MNMRYVVLFAGSALAACTAAPGPNAEAEGAVYGYRYHDANHTGDARYLSAKRHRRRSTTRPTACGFGRRRKAVRPG